MRGYDQQHDAVATAAAVAATVARRASCVREIAARGATSVEGALALGARHPRAAPF